MKKICVIGNGIHATKNIIPSLKEINVVISAIASEYLKDDIINNEVKNYSDYRDMLLNEKPQIILD